MSINPGGTTNSWNYSNPNKPGYSTQLIGTVLSIQEVQKRGFTMNGQPGAPEFWPDGNPKMNIRLGIATPEGELKSFTFQPAGKAARMGQKRSIHMDLFALTGNTDMMNLIGQTICIQTQEGHYGQGNPRPWFVQLVDAGPYTAPLPDEYKVPQVLANAAVSGGQIQAPPHPQPQQGFAPMYQQMPQQNPYMQQPVQYQQPQVIQQPQAMPQPQPQYQGMDPTIASAMVSQAFGAPVTAEMVPQEKQGDPVGAGYMYEDDEAMPF